MPTFDTPEPTSLAVNLSVGDVSIVAGDRHDTVVDVRPSDPSVDLDVRAAEQTRVEHTGGGIVVKAPKQRGFSLFGKPGSIDVTVELPAGSRVVIEAAIVAVRGSGRIADCRIKTGLGDVQLDHTGPLDLDTGAGSVAVATVTGDAEVKTGSGRLRIGEIEGNAVVKNGNGDNWVGRVTGELRTNSANGDVVVDRAEGGVSANSANGNVRVNDFTRGSASLKTAYGEIEIGIHPGTVARLDVSTDFGRVHNDMTGSGGPSAGEDTAEIHAHTSFGDVRVRRADPVA